MLQSLVFANKFEYYSFASLQYSNIFYRIQYYIFEYFLPASPLPDFLVEYNGDLSAFALCHDAIGFRHIVQSEAVRYEVFGMDAPPDQPLSEFLHFPDAHHP